MYSYSSETLGHRSHDLKHYNNSDIYDTITKSTDNDTKN